MRRTALLVLAVTTAGVVPALAAAPAASLAGPQTVTGSIAAPVALVARVPRTLALTNRSTNGLTGYAFDLDSDTLGGSFELKVTGDPTTQGDLQIGFYENLGTATDPAALAREYVTEAPGGEKGFVPETAKVALVYLRVGAQVSFSYKATPPVAVSLSAASLDVTVPKGTAVRWTNDTAGPLTVVGPVDEYGTPLFESEPLAPGATYTVPFSDAGTFAYTVGDRTGTVTVTA